MRAIFRLRAQRGTGAVPRRPHRGGGGQEVRRERGQRDHGTGTGTKLPASSSTVHDVNLNLNLPFS